MSTWQPAADDPNRCVNCEYPVTAHAYPEGHCPGTLVTRRTPLRTEQHILHLLLTIVTCGLWGIVWLIRASNGNRETVRAEPPADPRAWYSPPPPPPA